MDAVSAYSFASLSWHVLQALPLLLWPRAIAELLTFDSAATGGAARGTDAVIAYLARSSALAQVALGLATVVLSGSLPLASPAEGSGEDRPRSPYAGAVLLVTTLYHGSSASYRWERYGATGQTGFALGFAGDAALAALGLWCVMFAGGKARVSRRTGADKRTSGFPFGNAEAARRKRR